MTTDIVIFTIRDDRLEVLLIERRNPPFQGCRALPGGLVEEHEDLDFCAHRELEEETKVAGVTLEQLHAFGKPDRDPRGRLVTVAYYTLVRPERLKPKAASDAARVGWFAVGELSGLAFDHAEIIAMARRRLRARLFESVDAFGFLPSSFTMNELRRLAEIVGGERIDPRRFRSQVLALELVSDTGKTRSQSGRPAQIYRARVRGSRS